MSVKLGSIWIDNDSDLLVIVKSLEANCEGKVKVVFNYIVRTGSGCFEATSGLDLFLQTKTQLIRNTEKGNGLNKDEQNLNYRTGYNDGWHDCEASFELGNDFTDSIQEQAYDEGYDQAIDSLIEAGVIGEDDEDYLDEEYSDEEYSEYEFGAVDDDEDGEEEYCFSKELDKIFNNAFVLATNYDSNSKEEMVNHPKHYNSDLSGVECIEVARYRNFNVGSALKYLWRCGLKNGNSDIQDLEKAVWYLNDEIKSLKRGR